MNEWIGIYVREYYPMLRYIFYCSSWLLRTCWAWWHVGRFYTLYPKGRGFKSRSRRHVGTLGKSFTQLPVALRRETLTQYPYVSGVPLSSGGLEEVL